MIFAGRICERREAAASLAGAKPGTQTGATMHAIGHGGDDTQHEPPIRVVRPIAGSAPQGGAATGGMGGTSGGP